MLPPRSSLAERDEMKQCHDSSLLSTSSMMTLLNIAMHDTRDLSRDLEAYNLQKWRWLCTFCVRRYDSWLSTCQLSQLPLLTSTAHLFLRSILPCMISGSGIMAFHSFLSLVSVLLAAWSTFVAAQEGSDIKAIPLRTHSLQQVYWSRDRLQTRIITDM